MSDPSHEELPIDSTDTESTHASRRQVARRAKILTAILGTMFNVLGAYWFGISGVVVAGLSFSACYFVWMVIVAKGDRQLLPAESLAPLSNSPSATS